jgi:sulfur oxidation c-type cytochrome SoxX
VDKQTFKDPEKQNFSKLFLLLGIVLFAVLGWELYAEAIGRQPWIAYQERFKKLEMQGLQDQLAKAKKVFEQKEKILAQAPPGAEPTSMEQYRKRLSQAEALLNSPDYKKLLAQAENLKNELLEETTKRRFVKADLDAAYYKLDSAVEKKGNTGEFQSEVDNLKKKLESSQREIENTQAKLSSTQQKISLAEDTLQNVKREMNRETADLVNAEERIVKLEVRPAAIQQVVLGGLGEYQRVDRCASCHLGIDRPDFENAKELVFRTHPRREELFKNHPIEKYGCTICHDGQGRALTEEEAHNGDEHWHKPVLAKDMVNASCTRCHENAPLLSRAENVQQGARLFQTRGCIACHKVDNSPYLTRAMGKLGPDLASIRSKVDHQWLVNWIRDPKQIHPRTLMPEFGTKGKGLQIDQAESIAAYLEANSAQYKASAAALNYAQAHQASSASIAAGEHLFRTRGCQGCHDLGSEKASGPRHVALDGAGAKLAPQWIYTWIEDPKQISKTTIMPRFPLNADEIASISDFIASLKKPETNTKMLASTNHGNIDAGKKLIRSNGCYSCHSIPGFENLSERIGPELTEFSAKDPHLLFWGTKNIVEPDKRNWTSWTKAKLNEPKVFESDRIAVVMPNFHLSKIEINDLTSFLKTLSSENAVSEDHRRLLKGGEKAIIAGNQMLDHYGCTGCHAMYDSGKTTSAAFHKEPQLKFGKIAPNLSPEGDRVKEEWLSDFLRSPSKMRPYLAATMPTFNLDTEEHDALVRYFMSSAKSPPFLGEKETMAVSPALDPAQGKKLLEQYQCVSCHQLGGKELAGASPVLWYKDIAEARRMAPDLVHAMKKLDANWANRWMENPHTIMPDTTMPYLALTRQQVSKIRSYLKTLPDQSAKPAIQTASKAPTGTKR